MKSWSGFGFWKVSLAAVLPMLGACPALGQETSATTKTMTVVVSSGENDPKAVLDQLRQQLKNTGMSDEDQKKILRQVEESMSRAPAAAKQGATIVVHSDGKGQDQESSDTKRRTEKSLRALPRANLSMEDLRNRITNRIQGRILQGGLGAGPTYRIGISLTQKIEDDEDDDNEDDDNEDDEDADDEEGLVVEEVLEDSPARTAGIETGDVVVSVNGETLTNFAQLQDAVQVAGKGKSSVNLVVRRGDKELEISIHPMKTEDSDMAVMDLDLIPREGMVFGPGVYLNGNPIQSVLPGVGDESLKNEIADLKKEISELKKMLKKLLEK